MTIRCRACATSAASWAARLTAAGKLATSVTEQIIFEIDYDKKIDGCAAEHQHHDDREDRRRM